MFNSRKTVDSVTGQLNKIVADLDEVQNTHADALGHHEAQIEFHKTESSRHNIELGRAARVRAKVAELLS